MASTVAATSNRTSSVDAGSGVSSGVGISSSIGVGCGGADGTVVKCIDPFDAREGPAALLADL